MPDSIEVMRTIPAGERSTAQRIGVFLFRYVSGTVMDEKTPGVWTVSLGRVLTVALVIQAMVGWARGIDVLSGQQHVLIAMLAYTFGSKLVAQTTDVVAGFKKPRVARTRVTDEVSDVPPPLDPGAGLEHHSQ